MSSGRTPLLMANVVFSAVVVGVVLGLSLRAGSNPARPAVAANNAPSISTFLPADTDTDGNTETGQTDRIETAQAETSAPVRRVPLSPQMFSFADVADRVAPAVVTVVSRRTPGEIDGFWRFFRNRDDEEPLMQGHGSGFILEADGVVITNNHVVDGAEVLTVRLQDGREFAGKVVGTDAATDIAVLRIDTSGLPTVPLGDSEAIRVGDWVLAIGSPFREQLDHSVTAGIISGKSRGNVGLAEYEDFLQTDAAINPGNSGGPLVNLAGQVIGINTAIATRNGAYQGVSFAIPINFARRIVDALLEKGRVTRAWLGVQIRDLDADTARKMDLDRPDGVRIVEVYPEMPAARAGLRSGDVILAIDGKPTTNTALFRNRVSLSRPGQRVELEILRDGKHRQLQVELGELNDDVLAQAGARRPSERNPPEPDRGLGFELMEITPELAGRYDLEESEGLVVVTVRPGSAAAEAGLEAGDLIRAVNRTKVVSLRDFEAAIEDLPSDHPVVLHVKRGNHSFFVTLNRAS